MKKYLLDTHILIWWLTDDSRLSKKMREILANRENYIFISAVSAWEMSIKLGTNSNQSSQDKKLKMSVDLQDCFIKTDFEVLPIGLKHIFELEKLPNLHKDPFDRMLISQAISEECVLISADGKISQYSSITVIK